MKKALRIVTETVIILLPVAVSAAFLWFFATSTPQGTLPFQSKATQETPRLVSVIGAPVRNVVPRAVAYGTARPADTRRLAARTQGPVVYIHPDLRIGGRIGAGTVLFRIDSTPHKLNLARADAEILRIEAELEQVNRKIENDRLSLQIEDASLRIAERDLARSRSLFEKNAASQADIDADERTMLAQKRLVQSLQNSLRLAESTIKAKSAELNASHIALAKAQLELSYTEVRSPSDAFLSDLFVYEGQVVTAGQPLLETCSGSTMTVDCRIDYDQLNCLLDSETRRRLDHDLRHYRLSHTLDDTLTLDVRFENRPQTTNYRGRLQAVQCPSDHAPSTLALTVTLDNISPDPNSRKHNLLADAPCQIQISAAPLPNRIVLPHRAVHEDHVYVLDHANRLQRRDIRTAFSRPDYVVISHGLQPNDTVLTACPVPPTEGLLVEPVEDKQLLQRLQTTESTPLMSKNEPTIRTIQHARVTTAPNAKPQTLIQSP